MIYIGNFLQLTNQQAPSEADRRHGEFSLIVSADDYDQAVEKFMAKIKAYRADSDLFEGACQIFIIQLMEFAAVPEAPTMLTYKSYAGDPVLPFIGCSIPSDSGNSCRIYEWDDNSLAVDGYSGKLFAEFND